MVALDPDAGRTCGLCWRDSGRAAGEDAAAYRVLPPFSAAQPGWSGSPPWSLPGTQDPLIVQSHATSLVFGLIHMGLSLRHSKLS